MLRSRIAAIIKKPRAVREMHGFPDDQKEVGVKKFRETIIAEYSGAVQSVR